MQPGATRTVRFLLLLCCAPALRAQDSPADPRVAAAVDAVSEQRLLAYLEKLEGFGTRSVRSSQDDPERGIGAARRWIFDQFAGFSPRLNVFYDRHDDAGIRATLYNVVAELPGTRYPERRILITAHYDSRSLGAGPDGPAPGASDNATGVACILELARILSPLTFDKTLVFIAFAAEEEGLRGSRAYAQQARAEGRAIEAVLNNDIVGSEFSDEGVQVSNRIRVFSPDPGSRPIARYVRDTAARYVPGFEVQIVPATDRAGRSGDQIPFQQAGFGAVRLVSAVETVRHQHNETDTIEFVSLPYLARAARVNAAAVASLAWAPRAPELQVAASEQGTVLTWTGGAAPDLAGYRVLFRETNAPEWEREIDVGRASRHRLEGISTEGHIFGVKAVGESGNESLVTSSR